MSPLTQGLNYRSACDARELFLARSRKRVNACAMSYYTNCRICPTVHLLCGSHKHIQGGPKSDRSIFFPNIYKTT